MLSLQLDSDFAGPREHHQVTVPSLNILAVLNVAECNLGKVKLKM